jgi:hypothetical protein
MNGTQVAPSMHLLEALQGAAELPGIQAVHVLGRRSGTFYLNDGLVTGVDSSGTPDIRTRLVLAGWADDGAGRTGAGSPSALREDLRQRIEAGEVDLAQVGEVVRSVIIDAAWDLFRQSAVTAPRMRLEPGGRSTHGIDHRITVDELVQAVSGRLESAEALTASPDVPVELAPLRGSGVVLDDEEWRIVCHANGRLTPRDIAWSTGAELFASVVVTDRLVDAGLLTLVARRPVDGLESEPERTTAAPSAPGSLAAAVAAAVTAAAASSSVIAPQRGPTTPTGEMALFAPPEWADDLAEASSDDPEVIQRLITGLRSLG